MCEIWKPVVGYEGLYEVSCQGKPGIVSNVIPAFEKAPKQSNEVKRLKKRVRLLEKKMERLSGAVDELRRKGEGENFHNTPRKEDKSPKQKPNQNVVPSGIPEDDGIPFYGVS